MSSIYKLYKKVFKVTPKRVRQWPPTIEKMARCYQSLTPRQECPLDTVTTTTQIVFLFTLIDILQRFLFSFALNWYSSVFLLVLALNDCALEYFFISSVRGTAFRVKFCRFLPYSDRKINHCCRICQGVPVHFSVSSWCFFLNYERVPVMIINFVNAKTIYFLHQALKYACVFTLLSCLSLVIVYDL